MPLGSTVASFNSRSVALLSFRVVRLIGLFRRLRVWVGKAEEDTEKGGDDNDGKESSE